MDDRRRSAWCSLGLLLLIAACAAPAAQTVASTTPGEIVILHTNDIHGNIEPVLHVYGPGDSSVLAGGAASLATLLERTRRACGDSNVLLLEAGDIYQGTAEGNEYRGRLSVDIMNRLRYDGMTIGNHEPDYGVVNCEALIRHSHFPWMGENMRDVATGCRPALFAGPQLIERNGVRIGLFGITTEDMAVLTTLATENGTSWMVLPELPVAERTARQLRDSGADIVILLSHVGVDHDSAIAARLGAPEAGPGRPLVDLIVGGHSHTRLDTPLVVHGVMIVQTGWRGVACGEVRVAWDSAARRIASLRGRLIDLLPDRYPPDSGMQAFLKPYIADIERRMSVEVGRANALITRAAPRFASSPLGNLVADIMREACGTEIAFQNKGGIRSDILSGTVQMRDLYQCSPFGNTLVTVRLTGRQLRQICETSLSTGRTPLEVSGLTVYYDAQRHAGDRVVNLFAGKAPVEPDRLYTVTTNSFLGWGGDGYPTFTQGEDYRDTGRSDLDVLVAWFVAHPEGVAPVNEERWRQID